MAIKRNKSTHWATGGPLTLDFLKTLFKACQEEWMMEKYGNPWSVGQAAVGIVRERVRTGGFRRNPSIN